MRFLTASARAAELAAISMVRVSGYLTGCCISAEWHGRIAKLFNRVHRGF
jgi:hypothetical protein